MRKIQEQSQSLNKGPESFHPEPPKIKHVYLEQESIYGRFIPYLLLKDQITNNLDSSGNTVLHHMCTHNSPYIPLFLSTIQKNDPILNMKSKMGHTPLDVAGMYCSKQIVEMLKQKGAVDAGNVDHWAIQGGNIANWSGKVYLDKKFLIHWAAYNDMPQVLAQYGRQGANLSEQDSNGYSAIDLTILNKSYKSMRVLAQLGERPQPQLIRSCDSKAIKQYFKSIDQSDNKKLVKKTLKFLTLPLFLFMSLYISHSDYTKWFALVTILIIAYLVLTETKPEKYMNEDRRTAFQSQLLFDKQINRRNQIKYMLMHVFFILTAESAIISTKINSHLEALVFWILLFAALSYMVHLWVQIYGIFNNLTYSEMFESHKWLHLWNTVEYIPERKIVIRRMQNKHDEGGWKNLSTYYDLGTN